MATASTAISSVVNLQRPNPIRICFKEAKYEFLKNLRNPMYSVSTVLFPLMFYVLFGLVMGRQMIGGVSTTVYLIPAYGTFGVMGASLFGTAASLASERGLGWLQVKRASPMPPFASFLAKIVMSMIFSTTVVLLLLLLGVTFGGVHMPALTAAKLVLTLVAGSLPFGAMGLLDAVHVPAEIYPALCGVFAAVSLVTAGAEFNWSGTRRAESWALGSADRIHDALPRRGSLGTSTRPKGKWVVKDVRMKWNLSNSMGWALMAVSVLLLIFLRRLDVIVIVAPVAILVSYIAVRGGSSADSSQRRI